jgi:glutamate synthase domain-containing protein 2
MDKDAQIKNGRIVKSPEMERRINAFRKWYDGKGGVIVQANVEDTRLGVPEYVIEKLGLEIFELKWGQGAKDIGGEVQLRSMERARQLHERGYIVLPDPTQETSQRAFEAGGIHQFERHSRLGMVDEEDFYRSVEHLRGLGAKYVTLKTGAYRATDLARAIKFSSNAGIDLLTIDGAGGGTGMSPWRMMNEWGIPTVYLQCLAYDMCKELAARGEYVPPIAIAGGFSLEDHIYKAIALGAPFVKAVCLGRALMAAAMVGKTEGNKVMDGHEVEDAYLGLFAVGAELKKRFGDEFKNLPAGAIGFYSYVQRLKQGLQQLMAGSRKFALRHIDRTDLISLTREAEDISGIPYVMDAEKDEVAKILSSNGAKMSAVGK